MYLTLQEYMHTCAYITSQQHNNHAQVSMQVTQNISSIEALQQFCQQQLPLN